MLSREQLIKIEETYPTPTCPLPPEPTRFDEESMHRHYLTYWNWETTPPIVPEFPIGSLAINSRDELYKLMEFQLGDLIFTETHPWSLNTYDPIRELKVQKYLEWYYDGSKLPALRGVENYMGKVVVTDGHTRGQVAYRACKSHIVEVWVSLTHVFKKDNRVVPFTYALAEEIGEDGLDSYSVLSGARR